MHVPMVMIFLVLEVSEHSVSHVLCIPVWGLELLELYEEDIDSSKNT